MDLRTVSLSVCPGAACHSIQTSGGARKSGRLGLARPDQTKRRPYLFPSTTGVLQSVVMADLFGDLPPPSSGESRHLIPFVAHRRTAPRIASINAVNPASTRTETSSSLLFDDLPPVGSTNRGGGGGLLGKHKLESSGETHPASSCPPQSKQQKQLGLKRQHLF